jgi:hypothetical protein
MVDGPEVLKSSSGPTISLRDSIMVSEIAGFESGRPTSSHHLRIHL